MNNLWKPALIAGLSMTAVRMYSQVSSFEPMLRLPKFPWDILPLMALSVPANLVLTMPLPFLVTLFALPGIKLNVSIRMRYAALAAAVLSLHGIALSLHYWSKTVSIWLSRYGQPEFGSLVDKLQRFLSITLSDGSLWATVTHALFQIPSIAYMVFLFCLFRWPEAKSHPDSPAPKLLRQAAIAVIGVAAATFVIGLGNTIYALHVISKTGMSIPPRFSSPDMMLVRSVVMGAIGFFCAAAPAYIVLKGLYRPRAADMPDGVNPDAARD